ncbi:MAG: DUF4349 domain-containing protein [Cellulomonas sp.]|jgi:hypothetical protein|nr:DUF4349 domain-containing protein [Cellulomonas sp.]
MRTHVPHRLTSVIVAVIATGGLLVGCTSSGSAARQGGAPAPAQADYSEARDAVEAAQPDGAEGRSGGQADRQVIQTGRLTLTTKDPVAIVDDIVVLVNGQGADARVESRDETSGEGDRGGSATLTVRVPSDRLDATVEELKTLGDVTSLTVTAEDVTATAQDLDARIAAQRVSVERMTAVLAGAQTTTDIIAVEAALSERQADLESMVAERDRISDQVALSTLTIWITTPDDKAAPDDDDPMSFGDSLARGWRSLTSTARAVSLVFGTALPWLVLLGIAVTAVVLPVRRRRRRRPAQAPVTTAPVTTAPVGPTPVPGSAPTPAATGETAD